MSTLALHTALLTPAAQHDLQPIAGQWESGGQLSPPLLAVVAVLLVLALTMSRRALRPIKEVLVPLAAAGLAILAIGAALALLVAAAMIR
jgi:asparagine N-glycosylation enzyme membrane subunit Stt3